MKLVIIFSSKILQIPLNNSEWNNPLDVKIKIFSIVLIIFDSHIQQTGKYILHTRNKKNKIKCSFEAIAPTQSTIDQNTIPTQKHEKKFPIRRVCFHFFSIASVSSLFLVETAKITHQTNPTSSLWWNNI